MTFRVGLGALAAVMAAAGAVGLPEGDVAPADIVIHEICWTGTRASSADEWVELASTADRDVSLLGWRLVALDGVPSVALSGTIRAGGYFLLERTDDSTVADIPADGLFTGTLENSGEALYLYDAEGRRVDAVECADGWFAGETAPAYATMERVNARRSGTPQNWRTNDGTAGTGLDAAGHPLRGTPKAANSVTKPPHADFAATPEDPTVWDSVTFATLSADPDGAVTAWTWSLGGDVEAGPVVVHRFRTPGTYCVALEIEDDDGLTARCERSLVVTTGPGDLNEDGALDLLDVRLALQVAQGIADVPSPEDADVDRDGDADKDDARALAEFVLGL